MPLDAEWRAAALAAHRARRTDDDEAVARTIVTLTDAERRALPARLRLLGADDATILWQAAKAERDDAVSAAAATLADATARGLAGDDLAAAIATRSSAVAAARQTWAVRKAALISGEG